MDNNFSYEDDNLIDHPEISFNYYDNSFKYGEGNYMRQLTGPGTGGNSGMAGMVGGQIPTPTPGTMKQMPTHTPVTMQPTSAPTPGMMQHGPPSVTPVVAPVLANTAYTQGFLRTLIGKRVRISFLIGTSLLVDRVGTLLQVGTSYVVLRQIDSNINVMGDLYSIKFVDIYNA